MSDYLLRRQQQRIADAVCFARAGENLMYEKKIATLTAELAAVKAERDAALAWSDDDIEIPEDETIRSWHPMVNGSHKTYAEALRIVGAKRSKGALVDVVNWLLSERDAAREG